MANGSVTLDDYRAVAPRGTVDVLLRIGERLRGRRVVNVSGSRYSGAFVEVLNRLVPTLNELGIETGWEIVVGDAEFDAVAQAVAMALAGTEQVVTDRMLERLQATCAGNAARLPLEADLVIVHEAAPVLLVDCRPAGGGWVWRSHGDLSAPQAQVWSFLRRFLPRYEGVVVSLARVRAVAAHPAISHLSLHRSALRAQPRHVAGRAGPAAGPAARAAGQATPPPGRAVQPRPRPPRRGQRVPPRQEAPRRAAGRSPVRRQSRPPPCSTRWRPPPATTGM